MCQEASRKNKSSYVAEIILRHPRKLIAVPKIIKCSLWTQVHSHPVVLAATLTKFCTRAAYCAQCACLIHYNNKKLKKNVKSLNSPFLMTVTFLGCSLGLLKQAILHSVLDTGCLCLGGSTVLTPPTPWVTSPQLYKQHPENEPCCH